MIVAMGSLVALQWYFIHNALIVQKEQFDRNVKTALMETAKKIEQEEVLYIAQQRLARKEQGKLLQISGSTSPNTHPYFEKGYIFPGLPDEIFTKEFDKKLDNIGEKIPENKLKASEYINEKLRKENENLKSFIESNSLRESKFQEWNEMTIWLDAKQKGISSPMNMEVVKGVIHDLLFGEREISDRMGILMLDTLLKEELSNLGITIPYRYAVEDKGNIVLASVNTPILENSYRVKLFPSDAFSRFQFLYVYFPDRENQIFRNLLGLVTASTLLVMLVGGIFYYSATSLISERKLAKVKNDFINNMTHELKTPVSSISLALEVIRDKEVPKTPERTDRYLNIIQEENQRLASQIDKVLQMAKLEQEQIELSLEPLDVHDILENVLQNLEVRISSVDCKKCFEAKSSIINADQVHLTNIFYNLLDNALKYSKEHVHLKISTSNPEEGLLQIDIEDKGIGIAQEDQKRIFEKFYRVTHGDIHDVKGFGLGLSYVKSLVELHQGKMRLKSEIDQGSTFTLIFKA